MGGAGFELCTLIIMFMCQQATIICRRSAREGRDELLQEVGSLGNWSLEAARCGHKILLHNSLGDKSSMVRVVDR